MAEETDSAQDPQDDSLVARFRDPARRLELIATILMSIAVVSSAYCAWQATRWGGVQAVAFAEASTARVESSKALSTGVQQSAYDASTLLELTLAYTRGETQVVADLKDRFMREEFAAHVDDWLATKPFENPDAPRTPFDLETYSNANMDLSADLEEQAAAKFEEAKAANQTGDDYILATVYFATVLFFSGVSTKLDQRPLQWFVILLAAGGLAFGFSRALSLPFF